jgi:hypothetical protein
VHGQHQHPQVRLAGEQLTARLWPLGTAAGTGIHPGPMTRPPRSGPRQPDARQTGTKSPVTALPQAVSVVWEVYI